MRFGAGNKRSITVENDPPTANFAELAHPLWAGQVFTVISVEEPSFHR